MKKRSFLIFIIIILLALRDCMPFFSYQLSTMASLMLSSIAFMVFIIDRGIAPLRKYVLLYAIHIMNVIYSLFDPIDGSFSMSLYGFSQIFIWIFVCDYILENKGDKYLKPLYVLLYVIFIITAITTYHGCLLMPGASRRLATGLMDDSELKNIYASLNIGGFGFVYMIVLLLPFLFYVLRYKSSSIIMKIIDISIIVLFATTIYTTEYTTAILFAVLSISILILPKKLTSSRTVLRFAIMVPIVAIILSMRPSVFQLISQLTESYNVSIRMEELSDIMEGSEGYGDVQGRMNRWMLSWNNFINNIFTGTGDNGGGHSYILDTMSKYGMWGLVAVVLQFMSLYKITVKPYIKTDYSTLFLFVYSLNFCLCIFNTLCFYIIFLLFIPLFISQNSSQYDITRKRIKKI